MPDYLEVYFGAGCFWNSQLIYDKQEGVVDTEVGWCDISLSEAYPDEQTGRVEVVKVTYDSEVTNLEVLTQTFWATHNPASKKNKEELYVERSVLIADTQERHEIFKKGLSARVESDPGTLTSVVWNKGYKRAPEKDQKYYQKQRILEN